MKMLRNREVSYRLLQIRTLATCGFSHRSSLVFKIKNRDKSRGEIHFARGPENFSDLTKPSLLLSKRGFLPNFRTCYPVSSCALIAIF